MNLDPRHMTRSQVHDAYKEELLRIQARNDHPHATSMAMNEARRWLDRALNEAMPDVHEPDMPSLLVDHGTHSMTLGERLRQNIAEADRLRLEKEERANREAREKRERRNREVILSLDALKSRITRSIEEGSIPNPMRLPRLLEQGLNRHNTYINNPGHQDYGLWQSQMETWAHEQGLELTVVADHDGMGIESWLNLVVKPL